jgi:Fe-S cluster assembly ATPase SufC
MQLKSFVRELWIICQRFCISGNYSLPRILTYLKPTHVHIMINGKIIKTGHLELVEQLEKEGESFLISFN